MVGLVDGEKVDGTAEGFTVGVYVVGATEGTTDDGFAVGVNVDGTIEGEVVGLADGITDDGFEVGVIVDGNVVGTEDGFVVGLVVGLKDGDCVGAMNPVSVIQFVGLEHFAPLQIPLQQLELTFYRKKGEKFMKKKEEYFYSNNVNLPVQG